jgi:hypothetical protein
VSIGRGSWLARPTAWVTRPPGAPSLSYKFRSSPSGAEWSENRAGRASSGPRPGANSFMNLLGTCACRWGGELLRPGLDDDCARCRPAAQWPNDRASLHPHERPVTAGLGPDPVGPELLMDSLSQWKSPGRIRQPGPGRRAAGHRALCPDSKAGHTGRSSTPDTLTRIISTSETVLELALRRRMDEVTK